MSTLRLTFLYPHLFRSIRISEPIAQTARQCRHAHRASFATTQKRNQLVRRHGKAVEPFLQPGETNEDVNVFVPEDVKKEEVESGKSKTPEEEDLEEDDDAQELEAQRPSPSAPLSDETQAASLLPNDTTSTTADTGPERSPLQQAAINTADMVAPAETVLQMESPMEMAPDGSNIPHMHTPPYVHHFDSYTLVKGIEQGGFTPEQAITAMKALRGLLALNLDVAKEGLVSKSDVENESYLFRAACSELKTEIQNTRKANEESMRSQRTLLQHEVDILNQKLTQELLTLKDDLKGMFDDRKMAVRMEQRSMESSIQELNYKITVLLNSDSKSEVEGLRWVLTRRSVLAIVFMALMVLASLRYASYRAHEEEIERKRREKKREQEKKDREHHRTSEMSDSETQTDGERPSGSDVAALSAN